MEKFIIKISNMWFQFVVGKNLRDERKGYEEKEEIKFYKNNN